MTLHKETLEKLTSAELGEFICLRPRVQYFFILYSLRVFLSEQESVDGWVPDVYWEFWGLNGSYWFTSAGRGYLPFPRGCDPENQCGFFSWCSQCKQLLFLRVMSKVSRNITSYLRFNSLYWQPMMTWRRIKVYFTKMFIFFVHYIISVLLLFRVDCTIRLF